jgi:hypothetical protein
MNFLLKTIFINLIAKPFIMKKVQRNKNIIAIALFTALTLAMAPVAMADGGKSEIPVELKFLGNVNNKALFVVNFAGNTEENEFTVAIIDDYGNRLYRETVKGGNLSKRYLLDTESIGDQPVRFEISSNKTKKPAVFQVNLESHVVQDVVVNKL